MTRIEKMGTPRLLTHLKLLRKKTAQHWSYYFDDNEGYAKAIIEMELVKAELATREHYPRGAKGRALRQKAKQNR